MRNNAQKGKANSEPSPRIRVVAPPWNELPVDGYGAVERIVLARVQALKMAGHKVRLVAPVAPERLMPDTTRIRLLRHRAIHTSGPLSMKERIAWILSGTPLVFWAPYFLSADSSELDITVNDAFRPEPWNTCLLSSFFGVGTTLNIVHGEFDPSRGDWRVFGLWARRLAFGCLNTQFTRFLRMKGFRALYFPNGVEPPDDSLFVAEPERYLLFIGRLDHSKAPHVAVRLARRLGIELRILGPIRDQAYFESEIRPHLDSSVRYFGEVSRATLVQLLRKSLALVYVGTGGDPQPTVLLEALSFGVPILAIPPRGYSGFYDMLHDGENAVVSQTIAELASRTQELSGISRATVRKATIARWSWRSVVSIWYEPAFKALVSDDSGSINETQLP